MDKDNGETQKRESIEKLKKQLEEMTEKWKRAVADYVNLEKRLEKEKEVITRFSVGLVITSFLPVLDSLQEAAKNSSDSGFDLILKQFKEILEEEGVVEIRALGENFNPQEHEAIEIVKGEQDNRVVEVLRVGYGFKDKVLRPARVKVSKKEV